MEHQQIQIWPHLVTKGLTPQRISGRHSEVESNRQHRTCPQTTPSNHPVAEKDSETLDSNHTHCRPSISLLQLEALILTKSLKDIYTMESGWGVGLIIPTSQYYSLEELQHVQFPFARLVLD
ncbi:hypothetical protein GDO86_018481 [Hymenochirus boettgeri]|uniref:Uncharacterized protein n=1 Tax=Hymenochirus boettgeri TaxID=247094 RepID=A0A8T2IEJ8_9PIPI|nr:hypothetical protein GDO86_018481 [Hymenochirus boettgeri]